MAEPTEQGKHCEAFLAANADKEVHKPVHRCDQPPMAALAGGAFPVDTAIARRLTTSLVTQQSSFDVWAALARLDVLLSDYRRLAPRFSFEQLTGQPSVAAGNEYRHTTIDTTALDRIEAACGTLSSEDRNGALNGARTMDVRIRRAGPWGGETGEMVVETLCNHAMAGMASLWIVVHGEGMDGRIQVLLDAFEIMRWAWAPDCLAAQGLPGREAGNGILDWPYLFERLAESLDGVPETGGPAQSYVAFLALESMATDEGVRDALAIHPALCPIVDLFTG